MKDYTLLVFLRQGLVLEHRHASSLRTDAVFGIGFSGSHGVYSFVVKAYLNIMAMHHYATSTPIMAMHHASTPPRSTKKGIFNPYNAVPSLSPLAVSGL